MADATITYTDSNTAIAVPPDTDAIVQGSNDAIQLSAGDTIDLENSGSVVSSLSDSIVTVGTAGTGSEIGGAAASVTLVRGTDPDLVLGASATIDTGPSSGPISIVTAPDDADPISVVVPSGAGSLEISTAPDGSSAGIIDRTTAFSQSGGSGDILRIVEDDPGGTSLTQAAGSGGFGIYETVTETSAPQGLGSVYETTYDYVTATPDGYALQSIASFAGSSPELAGLGEAHETDTYSAPDGGGRLLRSDIDFTDGTSSETVAASGFLGIYQIETDHAGSGQTGAVTRTIYDFVAPTPSGGLTLLSRSVFTGNGTDGVIRTSYDTDAPDGQGTVTSTLFDRGDGSSFTIVPIDGDAAHELRVDYTGADGTGTVTATASVAAGTAASLFDADTSGATFPTAPSLADFTATRTSGAAAATATATAPAPLAPTEPVRPAASVLTASTVPDHRTIAVFRPT